MLGELETYISRNSNTLDHYIATRPILDLCLEVDRRPGGRVMQRWWVQERVYFMGSQDAVKVEDMGDKEG